MTALGIVLIVYALFVIVVAFLKPQRIWNTKKVQGFVSALTETGTVIFFIVWALIIGGIGIWLVL